LEKIRARLLDLTNRNRLLNFRHTSASSIRIVDPDLDAVFARLLNGEEIAFRPARGSEGGGGMGPDERSGDTTGDRQPAGRHRTRPGLTVVTRNTKDVTRTGVPYLNPFTID
jgi:hypothetical protein